jgi:hypothetical protein
MEEAVDAQVKTYPPNEADSPNPAMTSLFQIGHHRRRVGDPGR